MNTARKHRLVLMPSGRQGDVAEGANLLAAARQLGVELEAICGGRGVCGKCQVERVSGEFPRNSITVTTEALSPPSEAEQAYAKSHGLDLTERRLACMATVQGDLVIDVPAASLARKQIIHKATTERIIDVMPAMKLYYVDVPAPTPGGPGDWERLQAALAAQHGLSELRIDIAALRSLQPLLRQAGGKVTVTVWQDSELVRVAAGYAEGVYGLAIDVGSTTVVVHLCDLRTGMVLATETAMNPQIRHGEDLISRIAYAMNATQGTQQLHRLVIHTLNTLATQAALAAGIGAYEITDVVLVGNTVMHHLLLGIDPTELGHLPFTLATGEPVDLKARDLGLQALNPGAMAHMLPCIAGYVGADNVATLLAEYNHIGMEVTLVVDVGTNAEILLGTHERLLSASSPTGPAFEGAQILHGQRAVVGAIERVRIRADGTVRYRVIGDDRWSDALQSGESLRPSGICGSGIIEIAAELYRTGMIDASGRLVTDHPAVGRRGDEPAFVLAPQTETATGHDIVVTQGDIRAVQLAKAALYAGVRLLMDHLGVAHVDYIRLAGAFGSYIDPRYALAIGLLPACAPENIVAVGNAAGDGARMALLSTDQRRKAQQLATWVEYVETAAVPAFQDCFVEALAFPCETNLVEE
ncbi:MAG: DUF4445 domain-containing protein [Chloroflexi bacterium]|nr:DUF4445 domain-containing protein [Chloroflexota bacterium]